MISTLNFGSSRLFIGSNGKRFCSLMFGRCFKNFKCHAITQAKFMFQTRGKDQNPESVLWMKSQEEPTQKEMNQGQVNSLLFLFSFELIFVIFLKVQSRSFCYY